MPTSVAVTIATIPSPEKLREELIELYRATRLTRGLLRLAEKVHGKPKSKAENAEVNHAGK